jgi:hypothetical protein
VDEPKDNEAAGSRRGMLLGLKLRALVRDHLVDASVGQATPLGLGSALVHHDVAWVLLDKTPGRRLGGALAWALRARATALHVLTSEDAGTLARLAEHFKFPIDVWNVDDRELAPATPATPPQSTPVPEAHESFRPKIESSGADPVVEYGVLSGEARGLEVCRVIDDANTGMPRLEVGIGAHDREAFQMLHGDIPTLDSLTRIVSSVAEHRSEGAQQHPFNTLAAERLIRWRLLQTPSLVGARELTASPPPVPRMNLKDAVPCIATGCDRDDRPMIAVCASGVDLDVVAFAADARARAASRSTRTVVAMPERDRLPIIEEMAAQLLDPVEFVSMAAFTGIDARSRQN